jgi:hypothetical protein
VILENEPILLKYDSVGFFYSGWERGRSYVGAGWELGKRRVGAGLELCGSWVGAGSELGLGSVYTEKDGVESQLSPYPLYNALCLTRASSALVKSSAFSRK